MYTLFQKNTNNTFKQSKKRHRKINKENMHAIRMCAYTDCLNYIYIAL